MGPAPFSSIGKKARGVLSKGYNFDHKFTLSKRITTGMGFTAGVMKDQILVDFNTRYRWENTSVDVKLLPNLNLSTVTVFEAMPGIKTELIFNISGQKFGKLHLHYQNSHAVVNSSTGLIPGLALDVNASINDKDVVLGGEVAFNTTSASFTKFNAGISFSKPDYSAALMLMDKGQFIKASYFRSMNSSTAVAAEMMHAFSGDENSFTVGGSHVIGPATLVKARVSYDGKVGMLYRREWKPKYRVTCSAEYDTQAVDSSSKFGVTLTLKP